MAASDVIGSGTATGLLAFCDYLMERGIAPASAVNPWKSAAKNVFTRVEGTDDFGGVDVGALDVDEYMTRFVNKSRGEYKPDSLNAYSNRFRKAVEAYRGYLADPMGWRPKLRASSSRRSSESAASGRTTANNDGGGATNAMVRSAPAAPPDPAAPTTPVTPMPGLIDYPFPTRSGEIAHLHLPSPLDKDDADRLTQFVRALVFERQAQLPSGDPDGA
jgi:hypothetical protein